MGSLVVFEDGAPRPRESRTFAISAEGSRDDTSAVNEVVSRRFRPVPTAEVAERRRTFAYPPQLLVIDGGLPQVRAAARALRERDVVGVTVVGLAKRLEEVWLADSDDPIILPRSSDALYLLQRMRDEAHRVAIQFQRRRRSRVNRSALLDVPGLGPARAKSLLKAFGSIAGVRAAGIDELATVDGIGPNLAARISAALAVGTDDAVSEMLSSEVPS